jgi:hypothetical protein
LNLIHLLFDVFIITRVNIYFYLVELEFVLMGETPCLGFDAFFWVIEYICCKLMYMLPPLLKIHGSIPRGVIGQMRNQCQYVFIIIENPKP